MSPPATSEDKYCSVTTACAALVVVACFFIPFVSLRTEWAQSEGTLLTLLLTRSYRIPDIQPIPLLQGVHAPRDHMEYKLKKTSWVTEVSIKATRVKNQRTTSLAPLLLCWPLFAYSFEQSQLPIKSSQPVLVIPPTHRDSRLCPLTDCMKCQSHIRCGFLEEPIDCSVLLLHLPCTSVRGWDAWAPEGWGMWHSDLL